MSAHIIGVDWGSSNRRAYLAAADGGLVARREDACGVLSNRPADYRASLLELVGDWQRQTGAAIWLSGMVGARDGWQEVPYLPVPAALDRIGREAGRLVTSDEAGPPIRIVPGLCQIPPAGPADVMRGEETQLLGAWRLTQHNGWYVLPGTHSKWARIENGAVVRFHTFMTGELYARLREKGALASIAQGEADDAAAFVSGVVAARATTLPTSLFAIRAATLLGLRPQAQASSNLSGLLIGAEWEGARQLGCLEQGPVTLIGAPRLAAWYRLAAAQYGVATHSLDAELCYLQALLCCLDQAQS